MTHPAISVFMRAVRQKDEWYLKILDKRIDMGYTWAEEANAVPNPKAPMPAPNGGYPNAGALYAALVELEQEAERICFYDHSIRLLSRRLPSRDIDFASIKQDVDRELCFSQNAESAITSPLFQLHDPVGVFVSNGLVPVSLHSEFSKEMDRLAALQPQEVRSETNKRFHPHTKIQIQDLISPSLYPFVANVSRLKRDPLTNQSSFMTHMKSNGKHYTFSSSYSWIPSIFTVSSDEKDAHIESYISGLGPRENFPELYRLIELVFLFALPHLKRTVKSAVDCNGPWTVSPSVSRWIARESLRKRGTTTTKWKGFLRMQKQEKKEEERELETSRQKTDTKAQRERSKPDLYLPSTDRAGSSSSTRYKVIVKAVDYILDVGGKHLGKWHMEGMPHERIVASAIYYYDTDEDITDKGLSLRRLRDLDSDFPTADDLRDEEFSVNLLNDEPKDPNQIISDDDMINIPLSFVPFVVANTREGDVPVVTKHDDCPSDWEGHFDPDSESDLSGTIPIGNVPTHAENNFNGTGRIVSLPNWVQYKVGPVSYPNILPKDGKDMSPTVRRRVLCFFLVDDSDMADAMVEYPGFSYSYPSPSPIPTTADLDIGSMPCLCNKPTLHFLISKKLPKELVERILGFVSFGVTRQEAEAHRWEFKEEREYYVDELDYISQPTSLFISDGYRSSSPF